ncbi:probable ATP-dependent RNA helicase DDX52 [Pelobates cultripes]|uniref:Probable ATP-dependent RNA helicase DDX52 n=1 Tax=Pelobates cultripes TaxID=61616 RepID=A0AAD1R071_PELCU|nr:probable ATP-dependent RNA helicase DDX52 [Pelobates cultripes]
MAVCGFTFPGSSIQSTWCHTWVSFCSAPWENMDTFDLFRKLGSGARFDLKRFNADAEKFKLAKVQERNLPSLDRSQNLDFFGSKSKPVSVKRALDKTIDDEKNKEPNGGTSATNNARTKISKKSVKKQKIQENGSEENTLLVENQESSICWMSSLEAKLKDAKASRQNKQSAEKLVKQRIQKMNHFRNAHKIYVQGTDIPEPVATFEQLHEEYKIDPRIMQNVKNAGFQTPTPIQMQAIPLMLHGREILACAPTGSGKTMAFSIPILTQLKQPKNKGFRALIISPTRELASQTHRELIKLSEGIGFRIHMIDKAAVAAKKFGPKSAKKYDILVTTPNRVIYMLNQDPPGIDLSSVEWLVVDESDKLFEDGKRGFRDQLASIFVACTSHLVKRAMFSATFAHDVEQWCKLHLDNVVSVSIGARNSAADTVEQSLLFVGSETGKLLAMRDLIKKGFSPPVLVFVQSIDRAKELFHELIYEGMNVDVIHADKTQQQRENVIQSFREGKIWILICTSLLARGIDFKGVNLVINYDFPTSAVEYIHRIGRTGRAGHRGKAVTFFTEDDKPLLRSVASVISQAGCPVPDYIKHFKKLQSKQKKRMVKNPLKRSQIRTTPKFILEKAKRKRKIIQKKLKEAKTEKQEKNQKQQAPES